MSEIVTVNMDLIKRDFMQTARYAFSEEVGIAAKLEFVQAYLLIDIFDIFVKATSYQDPKQEWWIVGGFTFFSVYNTTEFSDQFEVICHHEKRWSGYLRQTFVINTISDPGHCRAGKGSTSKMELRFFGKRNSIK
jgi:hypothetical protein